MAPFAAPLGEVAHVHLLDFEGHGEAPPTGQPFGMARFAANILGYLDAHGIGRADAFGYSMGGYAALCLGAEAPERLGRIATLGTKFAWDAATAAREVARLDPEAIRLKVPRFADQLALRHGADRWQDLVRETAAMMTALGEAPDLTAEALATIGHPVRICVGDRDELVTLEESVATYRALPAGELAVLPATSHPFERVDAGVLARALAGFFGA